MTALQDWQRIEALFDQAWDRPAAERRDWLRTQSLPDGLRAEVERLLDAAEDSGDFLELSAAPHEADQGLALQPGERAGAWRVVAPLGRGGMGQVYEVERADGQYRQRAALKVIAHAGLDAWERFQNERRILAMLDHPGIARMIDGGILGDGHPYMVMEYVDGEPIDAWCRQQAAPPRQRVALAIQAAEALAHAHGRLVIHRDLKPSNLLVDAHGRVRLIDFGVARLSQADASDPERTPVSLGYAAPEQLTGNEAGTATDIYGLAAVLFRLLAGHPPHGVDNPPTALLAMRVLRAGLPRLRDTAAFEAAARVERRLLADLDAVLACAMQGDPAARYRSAEAFARDLDRSLRCLPVDVRAHEPRYRAARFLRRHAWPVATGTVAVASLAAGLGVAMWQAREAALQRDEALREQARLEAVQQSVFHMFRSAGEMNGAGASAGDILGHSARRVIEEFARDPARGAPVLHAFGELYFLLTDYAAAEPLLQRLADADPAVVDPALIAAGRYDLAQISLRNGDTARASALLGQAQAFWHRDPARWESRLIDSRLLEAQLLQREGDADAAIALLHRGLGERIAHSGAEHRESGVFHNNIGVALFGVGRMDEAREAFQAARQVWEATGLQDSPDALNTLNNWGAVELAAGNPDQAEALMGEAVELRRRLFGPSAATAALFSNYGKLLLQQGRPADALPLLQEAAAMGAQYAGHGSLHHVAALSGLADARLALGALAEAESIAREALALADGKLGAGHPAGAAPRLSLARVRLAQGRRPDVGALLDQVDAIAAQAGSVGSRLAAQSAALRGQLDGMAAAAPAAAALSRPPAPGPGTARPWP